MLEAGINRADFYRAPHRSPKVFNVCPHKRDEALAVFKSLRVHC